MNGKHKSNHKKVYSLSGVVEEWEWTDFVMFWRALACTVVVKTQQGIQMSKCNNGMKPSIQMCPKRNMPMSTMLQCNKNYSLSINTIL